MTQKEINKNKILKINIKEKENKEKK